MVTAIGPIDKSSPATRFYLNVDILSQNSGTNQSLVRLTIQSWNIGNTSSNYGGAGNQYGYWWNGGSYVLGPVHGGNPFLPAGYANGQLRWSDIYDVLVTHDANGYWLGGTSFPVAMGLAYGAVNETHYGAVTIPRIPRVPYQMAAPTLIAVSPTTIDFGFTYSGDMGGTPNTTYEHRISTDPTFATGVSTQYDGSSPGQWTGRAPGTRHYLQVRPINAVGPGPWSPTLTVDTLPAVAPGMLVTPSLNGQSASVALTPPGGATGVTKYQVEYRLSPGGATIDDPESPTSPIVVPGLTPGATYEWRSSAWFDSYQTPWTSWTPVAQPNPNTNPGDYYDGSSTARPDLTFSWASTVNNSRSLATGRGVKNWQTFGDGDNVSGGSGVVYQVTGGYAGASAARVQFWGDTTAAGFISGVTLAGGMDVEAGGSYWASAFVQLPRNQRMQAGVMLYDAADVYLYTVWGDAVALTALPAFQRLSMNFIPSVDGRAVPVVRDVVGAGHSLWLGGDYYLMDAAMGSLGILYPYFDGSFPDSPGFAYSFAGTAWESISERRNVPITDSDPLADPDCPPLPQPPSPPEIPSDCITEVGTWRQYAIAIPATEVRLTGATIPTLEIETQSSAERQVRIRYYENPNGLAPDQIDLSTWVAEQIISYIPPNTIITLDGVAQTSWAEVNGAEPISASSLLYGTDGRPATWPELLCGIGYVITFDVPLEAPAGNLEVTPYLTQRM